jgi:hypothetical protein
VLGAANLVQQTLESSASKALKGLGLAREPMSYGFTTLRDLGTAAPASNDLHPPGGEKYSRNNCRRVLANPDTKNLKTGRPGQTRPTEFIRKWRKEVQMRLVSR